MDIPNSKTIFVFEYWLQSIAAFEDTNIFLDSRESSNRPTFRK